MGGSRFESDYGESDAQTWYRIGSSDPKPNRLPTKPPVLSTLIARRTVNASIKMAMNLNRQVKWSANILNFKHRLD